MTHTISCFNNSATKDKCILLILHSEYRGAPKLYNSAKWLSQKNFFQDMLNILKFFADFDFHCGRGGGDPAPDRGHNP